MDFAFLLRAFSQPSSMLLWRSSDFLGATAFYGGVFGNARFAANSAARESTVYGIRGSKNPPA
jgi:hypothetical protein